MYSSIHLTDGNYQLENEEYHYLFPKALSLKYQIRLTGFSSFQLDLSGLTILPSQVRQALGTEELEGFLNQRKKIDVLAHHLASETGLEILQNVKLKSKLEIRVFAQQCCSILFKSIQGTKDIHPHYFDLEEIAEIEMMEQGEIAGKFAHSVINRKADEKLSLDQLLPEIEAYLNLSKIRRFKNGCHFFWLEHSTTAFYDCGIVILNAELNYLVYLQYLNDQ